MAWQTKVESDPDKTDVGTVISEYRIDDTSEMPDFVFTARLDGKIATDVTAYIQAARKGLAARTKLAAANDALAQKIQDRLNGSSG